MLDDYDIVVTNSKNELLQNKMLKKYKIYSLNEFINNYYYTYDIESIYYVMNKYNVIYDIAKIYLDNIRYVEDKEYKSIKLNMLRDIRKDLINKKLLYENRMFKEYLNNKKILFLDVVINKEVNKIINSINNICSISYKCSDENNYVHKIYEVESIEKEVLFVANNICDLVNDGVDINNIYITNIDSEYRKVIDRIFPMYNINYSLTNDSSIYGTFIVDKFLELYSNNMEEVLTKLEEYINSEEDKYIYDKLVDIVNKYVVFDNYIDVKELVKIDIKNTKMKSIIVNNSVKEVDIDSKFTDDDYVFLMGFNQGIIPVIYKDENYLSDKDREELDMSLVVDKNKEARNRCIYNVKNVKNLIISYKLSSNGEEYKISNINDELGYEVVNVNNMTMNYSNKYNKIYLASLLDEYYKYGTRSEDLYILNNKYNDINYNSYDNKYTGIDKNELKDYLNNEILLSYSSLDKYYRCPFSYYIGNILKLNIYEENFYQVIGSLFHSILEKCINSDITYEELWDKEISNIKYEFNIKERFFLDKLKKELEFVVDVLKYQETLTDLHDELHEEKVFTSISGDMKITFMGIIDKIKYKEVDGSNIIAIIDYKTGNTDIDLSTLNYGIGMQLPIYLYLAKNSKKLSNIKVAGFYIQKILNNELSNSKDYEKEKINNLKLQGYSNEDKDILAYLDNSYENSNLIKGMKVKNDGEYYYYSKVLSNKDMDKIYEIVDNKINEGANKICSAIFDIEPKRIDDDNKGCKFCKYKDICYRKNEDIVDLKSVKEEEVLGGEE